MGLYDYIHCKYPLPVEGANAREYQTKDTPSQYMENYEIREDGSLWIELYDIEDRSDKNAALGSLKSLMGCMTRVNQRWEKLPEFTGEIRFYDFYDKTGWIEFSTYFVSGMLKQLELLANDLPKTDTGTVSATAYPTNETPSVAVREQHTNKEDQPNMEDSSVARSANHPSIEGG